MNKLDRLVLKVTSGQWVLTVIGGLVFAYTACTQILPTEATSSILTAIVVFYFKRDRSVGLHDDNESNNTAK